MMVLIFIFFCLILIAFSIGRFSNHTATDLSIAKTYENTEIGYSITYPKGMFPPEYNCDYFRLYSSEDEKIRIESIRKSGIEIGYSMKGLKMNVCIVGKNPNRNNAQEAANEQFAKVNEINIIGRKAYQSTTTNSDVIFFDTMDNKIIRITGSWSDSKYKTTYHQMISTFKLLK